MPTKPTCRGSIRPRAELARSSEQACTTTTTRPRWSASFGQSWARPHGRTARATFRPRSGPSDLASDLRCDPAGHSRPPRRRASRGRRAGARDGSPVLDRLRIPAPATGPEAGRQAQSVTHFPALLSFSESADVRALEKCAAVRFAPRPRRLLIRARTGACPTHVGAAGSFANRAGTGTGREGEQDRAEHRCHKTRRPDLPSLCLFCRHLDVQMPAGLGQVPAVAKKMRLTP